MTLPSEEEKLSKTLSGIGALYEESLEEHGLTSKSVGWRDTVSQQLRFAKLAQVIDPAQAEISVNDLGCGYGAMFHFLDALPSVKLARYFGYDISPKMLAAAHQHIADPRAELIQSDVLTQTADYTFVSGTFNVRLEANDALWEAFIKDTLRKMAARSRKGLAFNLLTTYVDWQQDDLFYADPFLFFDFCKRNISRYVSLLHDYPLYEWTMLVRLEDNE